MISKVLSTRTRFTRGPKLDGLLKEDYASLLRNIPLDSKVLYFTAIITHQTKHCRDNFVLNPLVDIDDSILLQLVYQVIKSHVPKITVVVAHLVNKRVSVIRPCSISPMYLFNEVGDHVRVCSSHDNTIVHSGKR